MSNHKTKKAINTHHQQVMSAKVKKRARRQQRKEAFEATRLAIKLQVAYWQKAKLFWFISFLVAGMIIIGVGLVLYYGTF